MALDITLLSDSGYPVDYVSVGLEAYSYLAKVVKKKNFKLLSRISDYYQDTEYSSSEVHLFRDELSMLVSENFQVLDKGRILNTIVQIISLCDRAISQKAGLAVLAD